MAAGNIKPQMKELYGATIPEVAIDASKDNRPIIRPPEPQISYPEQQFVAKNPLTGEDITFPSAQLMTPEGKLEYIKKEAEIRAIPRILETQMEQEGWLKRIREQQAGANERQLSQQKFTEEENRSPTDPSVVIGRFAHAGPEDVRRALEAARAAYPGWRDLPWRQRVATMRAAAERIAARAPELAGLMSLEVGKNRLEALGEVEEAADLIRYYAKVWEDNGAYDHPMDNLGDAAVHTRSILRPFGVFVVIAPFNFPMALAAGPTAAALLAGNTCVFKPASAGAMSAVLLMEAYRDGSTDSTVSSSSSSRLSGGSAFPTRAWLARSMKRSLCSACTPGNWVQSVP